MQRLTHIGGDGRAQMVDVSAKPMSKRTAIASGKIQLKPETLELIAKDQIAKGNVFATARIAGIQAAKQTAHLIPLCHTLPLGDVKIDIVTSDKGAEVKCTAQTVAQTGVEMEALVGVTVALLTIYDMCKAADKEMAISDVHLIDKSKQSVTAVYDRRSKHRRHS
jgi:cyclic pyranopterin monophosphate synthase